MRKKMLFFASLLCFIFFTPEDTFAYQQDDYANRTLCGTYEVAQFNEDGTITTKTCHNSLEEASASMLADGGSNLAVLGTFSGQVKIFDANVALVDFTNPSDIIYLYSDKELNIEHSYMNGQSNYGAVDGAYLETAYSNSKNTFVSHVKIGGFDGWVRFGAIEIVPISWVKSASSYTVTADSIRHNYVAKIQNTYSGTSGSTIGPKPTMLEIGKYYSYDGHYFYKDLNTMLIDYKKLTYQNSVNKDKPYYNYYQYLSNHTRTNYSSINIDEYIRNNLGYGRDVYGTTALSKQGINTSRLYGQGTFFYNAQEIYGVNAALALGLSRNETGNGRSNIAINKNNGFGLNAVDSSPGQSANWYATFSSSVLGYANKWVTYGYSKPDNWRYYGNQYGNKQIGMNVKYASDVYWGEKMASNYYYLDRAFGLQDYDFYQQGITTDAIEARKTPTYATGKSGRVYSYRSKENALTILGEVEGQAINGNTKWYKVMSDLNIDQNFNEITSGAYNWNGYVYVPAAYVIKINEGKNGYISPNEVTEYQDKDYSYEIYTNSEYHNLEPKVGLSIKETNYYYDSTLTSKKGQKLLNNRYVMVYTTAYNKDNIPVAYLVTSDYKYDQKHWVSADSIKFVTSRYGQANVTVPNTNTYTIINPTTIDSLSTHISGLYHYAYVPILEEKTVDGNLWYKVPVDLSGDNLEFGWTLAKAPDVYIAPYQYTSANTSPTIAAKDQEIMEQGVFEATKNVTAYDAEDGDLTKEIKIISNNVNTKIPGTYQVTYRVTDKANYSTTKTITITVIKNESPVINAQNIEMTLGNKKPNLLNNVTATDKEDGSIKNITVDDSKVNYQKAGEYPVTYKVKDTFGHEVVKEVILVIKEDSAPIITATDKTLSLNSKFDPLKEVTATDREDGDLTNKIIVLKNTVKTDKAGTYQVTYQVTDSYKHTVEKTVKVTVNNKQEKEGTFYFDYLNKVNDMLQLRGYMTLSGINNTLEEEISYKVVFTDTMDKTKTYEQPAARLTDLTGIDRPIYSLDGLKYTHAWFTLNIDINSLPIGNYTMEIIAENETTYSKSLIVNKLYKTEITSYSTTKKNVNIKNNYSDRTSAVTLYIRDKETPLKTVGSYYNQFDVWRVFEFAENKLHLKGASYSYGMDLSKDAKVKRTIIFEEKTTYETYKFDLDSITNGLYTVALPENDNLDKTRAWYDTTIDISNLPKGKYKIYISTTSNKTDYSEFSDNLNRDLSSKKATINGKSYQFILNKASGNCIELEVS